MGYAKKLESLLCFFQCIGSSSHEVLWIRTPDYQQQLYINSAYETVWGQSCQQLYEDPAGWGKTLIKTDFEQAYPKLFQRHHKEHSNKTVYYRVVRPDGQICWIRDVCFEIHDNCGRFNAIVGTAENISPVQWVHETSAEQTSNQISVAAKQFLDFIQSDKIECQRHDLQTKPYKKRRYYQIDFKTKIVNLTFREAHCFYFLIQGFSTKNIANNMNLSHRTVEKYIGFIKQKFNCRNRFELLSRVIVEGFLIKYGSEFET